MIVGIDMGHTIAGVGYGAVGLVKESEETRRIGNLVIKYLREQGHTVINCSVDKATSVRESLNQICSNANKQKLDIFISIHLNASDGRGQGVEVFTFGGKYLIQAYRILKNIEKLGYRNRGIKDGSGLAVVRGTKSPAMLVECFFCDNIYDVDKYNADKMARAIVEGITDRKVEGDSMCLKDIDLVVHGDKKIVKGFVKDGTNYIPIRFLEELGYKLDWNKDNRSVSIEYKKEQ